jgi:hypothetical protein
LPSTQPSPKVYVRAMSIMASLYVPYWFR